MHIFVTGATGWIGSAVVPELLTAGHQVTALARSDPSAAALTTAGATPLKGSLDDLDSLRAGAAASDGVIHLAFNHDFSDFAAAGRTERAAVETICETLAGSDRPFLLASGLALLAPGRLVTEHDASPTSGPDAPRGGSEALAFSYADRGVRSISVRFAPTVHGPGDHGFMATLVQVARDKGASGYLGDGFNRWPAVHRADAAHLVRLALEQASAGSVVHAVAEEGIPARDIAEAIGRGLGLPTVSIDPEDTAAHFGWIGAFFGLDIPASSTITQDLLTWSPTHAELLEDLRARHYFHSA